MQHLKPIVVAVGIALIQGCDGGGTNEPPTREPGINGTYLYVSTPEFYFGTHDVGTRSTQEIEIANRGADKYPLNAVTIRGDNAEEFRTELYDEIVLNPAEAVRVRVTFAPLSDGRKFAELDVDYDTVVQVPEAVNVNEQRYYHARDLEREGSFKDARNEYGGYIDGKPVTINKQRAAIKLPVVKEAERYGQAGGADYKMYLKALDARDSNNSREALYRLAALESSYPDSYLADDAIYLQGYIQLMDDDSPAAALRTMQRLRKTHPDTGYYDTALYSEALAQQQLGNDVLAREAFTALRKRHTGIDTMGIQLAKDDVVSRLWFRRASDALVSLSGNS